MRIAVNGMELYFDTEGAGLVPDQGSMRERPVVVALHGGPGFDHACFKPWLSPLAEFAQVVYLDLRCQGRSSRPAVESCTVEQMADDVAAFCRVVGIERPTILGHSAGGFVALTLVVRHPETVGRLILLDTAAATADLEGNLDLLERRRGREAREAAERLFAGDTSLTAMQDFQRLVYPAYVGDPAKFAAVAETLGRSSFNADVSTFWSRQCAARYDLRSNLQEIHVPTLVAVGELDWVTPPSASQVIAAGIDGADLEIFPGVGHFAFGEEPEHFVRLVERFVTAPVPANIGAN